MLATICDDTWNVLNMQHMTLKFEKMGLFRPPGGGNKDSKTRKRG